MKRLLLYLARRIATRYGYEVYLAGDVDIIQAEARGLVEYAAISGHLTQAYRAGKTVRHRADRIFRAALEIERQMPRRISAN